MIVLNILFVILCSILSILLLVLFIPFGYKAKAVSLDERNVRFNIYWLFGLVGFLGYYASEQGFEGKVNIFGFKKNIETKEKEKKEKKEKKKKKKKRILGVLNISGIRYLLENIKKIIRHIRPDKIEGYGRLGFDDPYNTAAVCSFLEILRGWHLHKLNLDYVFDEEVYEGEINIEGRIFIIYLVYIAARLYLNKSTRKMVFN